MGTKAEKIVELSGIINKKAERIKKLKVEYGQQATKICVLELRIKELEAEIQEVSNQLMDLYTNCNETTEPKDYGFILGLHERLEQALKGKK